MAPHTGSATPEQIETLLNFLDDHKDLARGLLRREDGRAQAKRLWEELCNTLNSMGGCTKTVQQWQKVWFDRKHLAKKAAADSRRSASATGGGPSTATSLTQWELKVLSIMGEGFGLRQTGARVSAFDESEVSEDPIIPSTSSQASQQLNIDLSEASQEASQPRQLSAHTEHAYASQIMESQESLTPRRSSQSTRPRRRQLGAASDVRTRLFQFEEGRVEREMVRNSELAGIKDALLQLCGLIREFLSHEN